MYVTENKWNKVLSPYCDKVVYFLFLNFKCIVQVIILATAEKLEEFSVILDIL